MKAPEISTALPAAMTDTELDRQLDRQLEVLLSLGYPALAERSDAQLAALVEPLRARLTGLDLATPTRERVPFVLVVSARLVAPHASMPLTALGRRPGAVSHLADDIDAFRPIDAVTVPDAPLYLLTDVERGSRYVNVRPQDAVVDIESRGRTPITVDEGISFITQFPDALETNHCFSLVASRCGDRRVPALWISKRAPMLGWCFAGAPHTWLGSASAQGRLGPPPS